MRISRNARNLSRDEQAIATRVFGPTLPPWNRIILNDGLGAGDCPWTDEPMGIYSISIGPVCYPDCTSTAIWPGFGRIDVVFVHEMTHVWQYWHDYNVKLSSVWGRVAGDGYDVPSPLDPTKSWSDYNVEQEAVIVEEWYEGGLRTTGDGYPYVQKVVRGDDGPEKNMTLAQLRALP